MREVLVGALFAIISSLGIVAIYAWPVPERPVASLFPADFDGLRALEAVAEADGRILWQRPGGSITISVGTTSDHIDALYSAGAWLVIDADAAKFCLGLTQEYGA